MQRLLGALAALLLVLACQVAPALAANNGTNVLLIYIDDLNDWVGYMRGEPGGGPPPGATADFTPNIDALAASGVAFTRAYSPATICTPSRAATLGGRRPGYYGDYDVYHDYRLAFQNYGTVPITKQFMANGYDVWGAGKIYHPLASAAAGFNAADLWDTFTWGTNGGGEGELNLNGMNLGSFDWGSPASSDTNAEMLDYQNATTAIGYINATHTKPFFIAIGFAKPHVPWYVPATYFNMFTANNSLRPPIVANDLSDVPAPGVVLAHQHGFQSGPGEDVHALVNTTSNNRWNAAAQAYLAAIAFVDTQVGRVMAALNASPYKNNTIVVLMSDHGWNLGEKEHWHKMALWERTSRVPLIFAGPGITQGRSSRAVDLMSVYPTLTALTGVPAPTSGFDGVSIASLLTNPNGPAPRAYTVDSYWNGLQNATTGKPVHAIRTDRYRYIRYADGTEELYDDLYDPNEWVNLAGNSAYASVKTTMQGYLPTGTANNRPPIACFPGASSASC